MSEIKEYCIVEEYSIYELRKKVEAHIKRGWKPQGGVAIITEEYNSQFIQDKVVYVQALVK